VAATVPPHPGPDAGGIPAASPERSMRLGEILIARGKIDAEDLERALELQRERGDKIGKIFVDMGLIAQRDMLAALSDQLGIPLAAVDNPPPSAPEIDSCITPRGSATYTVDGLAAIAPTGCCRLPFGASELTPSMLT